MPGVEVFQLTDGDCPEVDGAKAMRLPGKMPMGVRRIRHYSQLDGDWVFVDTDVVFLKDVRPVFNDPFDVALATRKGSFLEGSQYEKDFPYNFGVVFSRSTAFWVKALGGMAMLPPDMQEWEGEQWLTGKLANSGRYKVKILPREFNYTPEKVGEDLGAVSVLHLKGPRKKWITQIIGGL
jgi:hypothetical protein